jgi:hypothetical protein
MKMQCKTLFLIVITTMAFGQSQGLDQLPACAESLLSNFIASSGCESGDLKCLCSNESFLSFMESQIPTKCTQDDTQSTSSFLE